MEVDQSAKKDPKTMSLDEIIKTQKKTKTPGNANGGGNRNPRNRTKGQTPGGARAKDRRNQRRRFNEFDNKGGKPANDGFNKPRRTPNMIQKGGVAGERDNSRLNRPSNASRRINRDNQQVSSIELMLTVFACVLLGKHILKTA